MVTVKRVICARYRGAYKRPPGARVPHRHTAMPGAPYSRYWAAAADWLEAPSPGGDIWDAERRLLPAFDAVAPIDLTTPRKRRVFRVDLTKNKRKRTSPKRQFQRTVYVMARYDGRGFLMDQEPW